MCQLWYKAITKGWIDQQAINLGHLTADQAAAEQAKADARQKQIDDANKAALAAQQAADAE